MSLEEDNKPLRRRRRSSISTLLQQGNSEGEDLHPAVYTDIHRRRRSLKSQPILDNAGKLFKHPDVPIFDVNEIFNDILLNHSIRCLKTCRRLSDEMAKLSLLEMKQGGAWASSRLFTKNPINTRGLQSSTSPKENVVEEEVFSDLKLQIEKKTQGKK